MKYFIILIALLSSTVFGAADKAIHREMTDYLNSKALTLESTSPNGALVYISERDNVNGIDASEVYIDNSDVSDGEVRITIPTTTVFNRVALQSISTCEADYGEVYIQPTVLIVKTDRLPVRVTCKSQDKSYSESYKTIFR